MNSAPLGIRVVASDRSGRCVNRVVERTEHQARVENGSPTVAELLEGHGPGSLVQRDPVDVEKL